jgi:hypothetical protein
MPYNVKIKLSDSGTAVHSYPNTTDFGYLKLEEIAFAFEGGWLRPRTRTALLRGIPADLDAMVRGIAVTNALPGKIVVNEFLESEIPATFENYLNKSLPTREAQLDSFYKRAGSGGPVLCLGGERIVRFSNYDHSGALVDTTVAHDNTEAIAEFRATQQAAEPALPNK